MKKLITLPLLLTLCLNSGAQKQLTVDSIGKRKGQTIQLFCSDSKGEKQVIGYNVRGFGRAFIFVGDIVTFYPEGKGRRKNKFQRNN